MFLAFGNLMRPSHSFFEIVRKTSIQKILLITTLKNDFKVSRTNKTKWEDNSN